MAAEAEKAAKNARSRAKSALTRIYNFINDENQIFDKHDVNNKLQKIDVIYSDFDKADSQLSEENSEIEDFEKKYYETKAKLQKTLEKLSTNANTIKSVQNNDNLLNSNSMCNFKLPRLNIESFNGQYQDWPSFKDLYVSLVHTNDNLSDIQKFQYLKGLLGDQPTAIIKHIPVSDSGYNEAWERLLARYDRKKQIVNSLIKAFMDQPIISHANYSNLRNIADISDEVIRGLKSIDTKATSRDIWLIYILLQKLDLKTREEWSKHTANEDFPSFEMFLEFINNKCASLELCSVNEFYESKSKMVMSNKNAPSNTNFKCPKCKSSSHFLFKCVKFKEMSVKERKQFVNKLNLCVNCLSDRHSNVQFCNSAYVCHICKLRHHSLLHENKNQNYHLSTTNSNDQSKQNFQHSNADNKNSSQTRDTKSQKDSDGAKNVSLNTLTTNFALLPTARIYVKDSQGISKEARILCDSGSMCTIICSSFFNSLGLKRKNARFPITGLANTKIGITKGSTEIDLISRFDPENKITINALILDRLTTSLPAEMIHEKYSFPFKNVSLADPAFIKPDTVDIILGCDNFFSILLPEQIKCSESNLIAQNSIFGFLISGTLPESNAKLNSLHIFELNIDLELRKFWEIEEINNVRNEFLSPEELFVETHFKQNYSNDSDGRFIVKLPFYKNKGDLGNSKAAAISRLLSMERKFKNDPEFESQYKDFMHEYEMLNHMTPITEDSRNTSDNQHYFLPHHAVIKPSSTTTKMRVVFDASCKTTSGISLNSILGVGPKLQRDIFQILLNFRFPKIVFTADIEKMYRQVLVAESDQPYQQIVWRYNSDDDIRTYRLRTVTYGLAPASFLATRCIKQIALDCQDSIIARILQDHIYMDDLLSGSDSVINAIAICKEIASILLSHGFNLRKWNSNSTEFLEEFREHSSSDSNFEISPDANKSSKVLGLFWNSSNDTFIFKAALALTSPLTKRRILSESSRIFDPLGLLSPCTVTIKIFYQKLWLVKGDWDTPISQDLEKDWFNFQESFNEINHLYIPRCVTLNSENEIQLHGFCDASSLAYAAAIYCRQTHDGITKVNLLVAKNKVAPIKQISIPRLELCGAHLLAKLFRAVMNTFENNFKIFAWTDSKVVLSWLSSHPRKWKTFVANRTSHIIEVLPASSWNHVASKDNPADIASRGIDPKCLPNCDLWWYGPIWLKSDQTDWPKTETSCQETDILAKTEQKSDPIFSFNSNVTNDLFDNLFERYSSLSKIIRILAYCQKFTKRCKNKNKNHESNDSQSNVSDTLTFAETRSAEEKIVHWIQNQYFAEDIKCIKEQKNLKKNSQLKSLLPFVDTNGILKVGGRLQNSSLPINNKHPVILPSQHKFSELLIKEKHAAYLHAGPTLLSHLIRQSYWIIGGKRLINKCINRCVKCNRFKAATNSQLMGNLPKYRVTPDRPFAQCGTDYAGPVSVKFSKGRGAKITKGYIALFICLVTKAIHLEAVSDLTADAFLAALRRFSARRGAPRVIYSDNGTNYHGAHRKLNELQKAWLKLPNSQDLAHYLTQSSIKWHFIPPAAPHFGGIWEAGIRSVKFHLKRVIGDTALTFEEITTLLAQIESLLNSRPLTCTNDNDINSIDALTPSHFLTGDLIASVPDDPVDTTKSCKGRWEQIQNLKKGFWKRWQREYLSSLQTRHKWQSGQSNVQENNIVVIKEDSPPGLWPLGRIMELHPGTDGLVRVASIKTLKGVLKRPISKLIPIPTHQD